MSFHSGLTIPNLLTYFRILASLVLLVYGLQGRWEVAFPIFLAAAATDMVDGTIARVLRQRTRLGAFLDPVADKTLMFVSFLSLTIGGVIPWAIAALVFARDLLISVGLYVLKRSRATIVYQPTYLSKFTTLFQILVVLGAFFRTGAAGEGPSFMRRVPYDMLWAYVLGITALLTAMTAVQYTRIGYGMFARAKA